jgi:O-antigen/teichoic acid export membrane protein
MEKRNSNKQVFMRNFGWKFAERICAQVVTFAVSIILARILGPEDYGAIALVTVFITLANVFVSDGLGSALIQKKEASQVDFSTMFYTNLMFSGVLYLIIFLCAPFVASFYEIKILCPVMRALGLKIPLAAINSVQQAYVSRKMIFKKFFFSTIIGTVLSAIVGIVMAYNGLGIWALVAQYLVNSITDTIILWITVKWRPTMEFSVYSLKTLFSYGWKILAVGLLTNLYDEIRTLIIGKMYTSSDLAYFNRGKQFPHIFITNVNSSISSVLFPMISRVQDDKTKLKQYTKLSISVSSYIMSPLMVGLAITAPNIIKLLLTEKWIGAVPFLRVFCAGYLLLPIQTANLQAIKAAGRSDIYLKVEIVKKIVGLILLITSLRFGILAIAISAAIASFTSSIINSFPNKKMLDYGYVEQVFDIVPNILLAIIMGGVICLVNLLRVPIWLELIAQIFVGIIAYVALSIMTKNPNFKYLLDALRNRK